MNIILIQSCNNLNQSCNLSLAKESLFWTPEGKRQRGRPRITWRRSAEKELKSMHLTWNEIRKVAQDRSRWRETVEALCVPWRKKDWWCNLSLGTPVETNKKVIKIKNYSKSTLHCTCNSVTSGVLDILNRWGLIIIEAFQKGNNGNNIIVTWKASL